MNENAELQQLKADAERFFALAKLVSGEEWERISGRWPTSDEPNEYREAIDNAQKWRGQ